MIIIIAYNIQLLWVCDGLVGWAYVLDISPLVIASYALGDFERKHIWWGNISEILK